MRMKALLAATAMVAAPAHAQDADFYKGRTVNLYIGFTAGGYDMYGRAVARHIGKHIPGRPDKIGRAHV